MQTTDRNANSKQEKAYDFKPVDFDAENMEPEAAAGEYEAVIDNVKIQATSKDNFPMLVIEWKLEEGEDEKSIGAIIADFIAFFPEGDRRGRMGKLRYRQLCELVGVDLDVLPTRLQSKADFKDFVDAVKAKRATVFVTHRADKETGETRVGVQYTAPKGGLGPIGGDEEEGDKKPAAKSKTPAKKSARR